MELNPYNWMTLHRVDDTTYTIDDGTRTHTIRWDGRTDDGGNLWTCDCGDPKDDCEPMRRLFRWFGSDCTICSEDVDVCRCSGPWQI